MHNTTGDGRCGETALQHRAWQLLACKAHESPQLLPAACTTHSTDDGRCGETTLQHRAWQSMVHKARESPQLLPATWTTHSTDDGRCGETALQHRPWQLLACKTLRSATYAACNVSQCVAPSQLLMVWVNRKTALASVKTLVARMSQRYKHCLQYAKPM